LTSRDLNQLADGKRPGRQPCSGSREGLVLIIVMIVIVMMSLAGLSFVLTMSTENKAVHLHGDELRIEQVAASGEELLKALCELSPDEREQAGGLFDNPDLFRGVVVVDDESRGHRARFSIVSPRVEEDRLTGVRFGAENESARLNLAILPQWDAEQEGAAREALMNLPGMSEPIADAILDWIDVDPTPRPSGAEAEYYSGLGVPYGPRNGLPTSLDELLLIRDVSRELLFGPDADFNYQVEAAESQLAFRGPSAGAGPDGLPWASLLTVYSAERNVSYEGKPRINLNEKDLAKLQEQLDEVFDPDWTRFIIAYRQFGPYEESGRGHPGFAAWQGPLPRDGNRARRARSGFPPRTAESVPELDLSRPPEFNIDSVLDLIGVAVQLGEPGESPGDGLADDGGMPQADTGAGPPPGEPSGGPHPPDTRPHAHPPLVLESPFRDDRVAMQDYLPKLADHTTVTADKVIRGRVNVNEAPRVVLLGVPGLDGSMVEQIITARGTRLSQDDPTRRHATWLLTEGIVDLEQMKELMPYLTAGGDVFRAQVVGYFDDSGPSARAEVVIDGTTSPPRQVYWKDLRLLGRGYPLETLGAEPPGHQEAVGLLDSYAVTSSHRARMLFSGLYTARLAPAATPGLRLLP